MGLTESEIKEMVPPIGLAKKIMKLVPKVFFFSTSSCCRFPIYIAQTKFDLQQSLVNKACSFIHGVHAG